MSCKECEIECELALNKNIPNAPPVVYYRIGTGNIAIVGCRVHVKKAIDKLNKK